MRVLGIYYGHNSTACLYQDGIITDCISEERFTRKKNQTGTPTNAIKYILEKYDLEGKDLDKIVVPVRFTAPIYTSAEVKKTPIISFLNFIYNHIPFVKGTFGFVSFYNRGLRPFGEFMYKIFQHTVGRYTSHIERTKIANLLEVPVEKVTAYDHHLCHAYSAYFSSKSRNKKTLVFTLDAEGDGICATVGVFKRNKYELISKTHASNSLGLMYAGVTKFLNMKPGEHEYKVMGMAPYAKEYAIDQAYPRVEKLFSIGGESGLEIQADFDMRQISKFLDQNMSDVRFDVVCGVFQKLLEDVVVDWVTKGIKQAKVKNVCLGGGVFMNVKLNQKILDIQQVKSLHIMPSAGDESTPIGACYAAEENPKNIKPLEHLYLGPKSTDNEISTYIKEKNLKRKYKVKKMKSPSKEIAKLLSNGKIVARMAGNMEWGARALGNRSILANPALNETVIKINEQVKNRDFWMPFTPSIKADKVREYVELKKDIEVPYMILALDSTQRAKEELRAALHPYDFTARPQAVYKEWNKEYYEIIDEFEKLTGIAGVLNTSFNLHGLPIVMKPEDAMVVFEGSELEYLALGSYLIQKK